MDRNDVLAAILAAICRGHSDIGSIAASVADDLSGAPGEAARGVPEHRERIFLHEAEGVGGDVEVRVDGEGAGILDRVRVRVGVRPVLERDGIGNPTVLGPVQWIHPDEVRDAGRERVNRVQAWFGLGPDGE